MKEKDKKYYAVPAKDVTDEMSQASRENYQEFVKIEDYKKYEKEYEAFIRKIQSTRTVCRISLKNCPDRGERQ